ncbi:MAG: DUF3568 domain-containing protein [Lentisphaeraceae bacterium]|nr:DUF3568 domain-containing protein [Lentisphaeraceae bacterium]
MKTFFKALVISSLLLTTSCIEMAVGGAVVATGTYIAKQGYVYEFFDRSYDSCWQIMDQYVQELGTVTFHSKNQGIIKIDFEGGGEGTFRVEKVTDRATKVSVKCYQYAVPSNTLAETHFTPLAEKLQ